MSDYRSRAIRSQPLADRHKHSLQHESGIDPEVIAERGYHTAHKRSEVPTEFKKYQRRVPGLLIPTYSPDGVGRGHQLRPNHPRKRNGKTIKYETPGGSSCILDVHPRMLEAAGDANIPLFVTEGIKKADALTSRGLCTVGLVGVWNFQRGGELLPDWDHVALSGREVVVVFDSDVMVKPEVQIALQKLVGMLEARGACVRVVYLPDAGDGGKQGVDDWLVAGGTVEELSRMAREFVPAEVGTLRLSRLAKLRLEVVELHAIRRGMPAKTMGQNTRRSVMGALIRRAERHGKPVADGVRVVVGRRELAEEAASSVPSVNRAIAKLEEEGYVRRDNDGRKRDHAGGFVLLTGRALAAHHGGEQGQEGQGSREGVDRGEPLARASVPELRWPFVVALRERDDLGRVHTVYEQVRRLGKKRGAVVEHLLDNGGTSTIPELMGRFAGEKTRKRDFKGRVLADLAGWRYDKDLRTWTTTGPQIIEVEGDTVRLREDWLDALDIAREMGDEQGAARRQHISHELQRIGYREHLAGKHLPGSAPSEEEMEERRTRRRRDREAMIGNAVLSLYAENPEHRELYPDQVADAIVRLLPDDFPRSVLPYGKPKAAEVVEFLENHELPVPTPIYDRTDRPAERRFREMERAAREAEPVHSHICEVEPRVEPSSGPDGVIHHGPDCLCDWCEDAPAPKYAVPGRSVNR